ncbi:MAG TPA: hypothetical protein DEB06_01495, partial [Phycisphaerales bacterium]|nr:hypothetical protein [Phycisphaerales bacterium]
AAGALALAGLATLMGRSRGGDGRDALLLPELGARINHAAAVSVRQGDHAVTLTRAGEGWTVAELDGYPAKFESVKPLILSLAEARTGERKTSRPDLYPRIAVQDPGPGSPSVGVTITDASGAPIASVILGNTTTAGSANSRFLRPAGDAQSWLVVGSFDAPTDPLAWVDREIIRLGPELVAFVRTELEGDTLTVAKGPGGSLTVEGLPDDREPRVASELQRIVGALSDLTLAGVAAHPSTEVPVDAGARTTVFARTDGVALSVRSWSEGEKRWITLSSSLPAGSEVSQDARLQHEDYTKRFSGWRFALEESRFDALRPSPDALSRPRDAEGPPEPK